MIIDNKKVTSVKIGTDSVVKITDPNGVVLWQKEKPITATPMYFENVDSVPITIGVKKNSSDAYTATLQTSTDGINWEDWGSTSETTLTKSVPVGDKLYVKAIDNAERFNYSYTDYNYFTSDGKVSVGGNIMSLGYKDFEDKTSITKTDAYTRVFSDMTNLVDASNLVLSATTLGNYCYSYMFNGCTSLTEAPELPATTLASYCYQYMFQKCTSLTTAPALPATTLATQCYYDMFGDCTSLTAAPALPATELARYCYVNMFEYCTSLTAAPALPATELAQSCYTFMFDHCISLTAAPELPATTLADSCYRQMFNGCTNINNVTTYANDISATNCLFNWLSGVSKTGDFYNLGSTTYESGSSGIPTGWTEHTTLD